MFVESVSDRDPPPGAAPPDQFKDQVLREVHHRVKNHLQVLQGLVRHDAAEDKLSNREIADRLVNRIGGMAAIYEAFQEAADRSSIAAVALLRSVCQPMSTGKRVISVQGDQRLRFDRAQAEAASMLVSEAVCNSLEHAFPGDRPGQVVVGVRSFGRRMQITVDDNGVGCEPPRVTASHGMKIMTALASQLRGELRFYSSPGCGAHVDVRFPFVESAVDPGDR